MIWEFFFVILETITWEIFHRFLGTIFQIYIVVIISESRTTVKACVYIIIGGLVTGYISSEERRRSFVNYVYQ